MGYSNIDYLDRSWNFYEGCLNWKTGVCGGGGRDFVCWAKTWAHRFEKRTGNDFTPRLRLERLLEPLKWNKSAYIGVCFTGDLFGDWVDPEYDTQLCGATPLREAIFNVCDQSPQHTFLFLTKAYANLAKWSPFPKNAWVGASVTRPEDLAGAVAGLKGVRAGLKYLSLEPLTADFDIPTLWGSLRESGVGWLIIGGTRGEQIKPTQVEWVENAMRAATLADVPVFLKKNLTRILPRTVPFFLPVGRKALDMIYHQEYPAVSEKEVEVDAKLPV